MKPLKDAPLLSDVEFDEAVDVIRDLAAKRTGADADDIAHAHDDDVFESDLATVLSDFEFQRPVLEPSAATSSKDRGPEGIDGTPEQPPPRVRPDAPPECEGLPSLRFIGWMITATEATAAIVLAIAVTAWFSISSREPGGEPPPKRPLDSLSYAVSSMSEAVGSLMDKLRIDTLTVERLTSWLPFEQGADAGPAPSPAVDRLAWREPPPLGPAAAADDPTPLSEISGQEADVAPSAAQMLEAVSDMLASVDLLSRPEQPPTEDSRIEQLGAGIADSSGERKDNISAGGASSSLSPFATGSVSAVAEPLDLKRKEILDRERADALAQGIALLREQLSKPGAHVTPSWMTEPMFSGAAPSLEGSTASTANALPQVPAHILSVSRPERIAAPVNPREQRLLERAETLLRNSDISGARLILERAVADGSARAAYRLAQTYDPRELSKWSVLGVRGNPARAQELYEKARSGGVHEAEELVSIR